MLVFKFYTCKSLARYKGIGIIYTYILYTQLANTSCVCGRRGLNVSIITKTGPTLCFVNTNKPHIQKEGFHKECTVNDFHSGKKTPLPPDIYVGIKEAHPQM